ncbi:hypothetical protein HYPSUDRAFT_204697 [Hypholoma sublateritium FD-334 SS-4]|uniref:D-isomer specific 2-hydroxyacid dehydrogenase NAD-binding domain-containing protein n=1 Tax=Hypholoma sublateritium (strain FD-334 SS-4) TaxID=945553 RepID=A0A0D2KXP3_HYPSF|nr:hypothetical protein HYPSUDRAFT_204697 [Hypholoma sublateritium FD-334 SS-4]
MCVTYYSLSRNPDAPAFCEYFMETDVLGVYVPLHAETMGLVGEKMTRALIQKPGAIIVNTAREKVIDEPVLISALDDGHSCSCAPISLSLMANLQIAAASLDVFLNEPEVNPRFFNFPHGDAYPQLLPHMGTESRDMHLCVGREVVPYKAHPVGRTKYTILLMPLLHNNSK